MYPDVASTPEELFDRADYALYQSKREHRGNSTLFTTKHIVEIHRDARVEQTLRQADLAKELSVVYQPILDVTSGKTVGFEALARWESRVLGTVGPAQFIPIAERAGIISMLTKPLLKQALAAAKTWPKDVRLSFNLSAQAVNSTEATLGIIAIIATSGFDPQRLDLEITETAIIHDTRKARNSVEMLRKIGCGISLDDFGTGYSSLTSLHSLPLTKLKIDRSFVRNIQDSAASYNIVRSLLTLSREMGLNTIVEGVETQAELDVIKTLGGTLVQGYVFSRPIQTEKVHAFLNGDLEESLQKRA
ncbi:putative bifunctional diguanylate cyclase/phosphodiesterase [Agrobacterium larrymoorei]|uniref:putative bifunctional diguanylate cyclase/phosphodiesterase n=1 Tax=Agrobacterium larrymoorei TaxID=160699 RepID=UPI003593E71A